MAKAPRLKDLRGYLPGKSDEEIIEYMRAIDGREPFHLPPHAKEAGEIAFRRRRQR